MKKLNPYIIEFPKLGTSEIGYISVAESFKSVPFEVKRMFWTYFTPESIVRGRHAHYLTQQVLIAVSGRIIVNCENRNKEISTFLLDSPNKGLFLPAEYWHTMQYSHNSVQLVLASTEYNENDYIRDYEKFVNNL